MIKERIVPEHKKQYVVCDYCKEEITDYTSISTHGKTGTPIKHFHSMYVGGSKGEVKETCHGLYLKYPTKK